MNRVVITGMGVVCGNAADKHEFADACFSGKNGIKKCTAFGTEGLLTSYFGQADCIQGENRFYELLERSAKEMMDDANISREEISAFGRDCRMFFGTLLYSADAYYRHSLAKQEEAKEAYLAHMNDYSMYARELTGVKGAAAVSSAACASGTTAAGMGFDYIRSGLCSCAVVGGVDALSIIAAYGFHSLKSLSGGICSPYDKNRDGINIGECGAFFLFESLEAAKKRNADIYCEVLGYGSGNDAWHITSPEPNGEGAYRTMKQALEDSGISSAKVSYINGHGTGTLINDSMEVKAVERLMEGSGVCLSSTKSMVGHCMGASGAIELASILLSMQRRKYLPMPRLSEKMECHAEIALNTFDLEIEYALSNSFGFAGNSACLAIGAYQGR